MSDPFLSSNLAYNGTLGFKEEAVTYLPLPLFLGCVALLEVKSGVWKESRVPAKPLSCWFLEPTPCLLPTPPLFRMWCSFDTGALRLTRSSRTTCVSWPGLAVREPTRCNLSI